MTKETIEEILKKFDNKYKEVWSSRYSSFIRIPDGIKGNMLKDISSALTQTHNNAIKLAAEKINKFMPTEDEQDDNDDGERYVAPVLNQAIKNINNLVIEE